MKIAVDKVLKTTKNRGILLQDLFKHTLDCLHRFWREHHGEANEPMLSSAVAASGASTITS
jgi:hypothetical protein